MHIPDGLLPDAKTMVGSAAMAAGAVGLALWQANKSMSQRRVPLLGLTAAFIFAAQMVNFPVAGGTSGHLVGGTLAAVLLGPWAAMVAMACVLIVQCFLFNDGGVWVLGANIFNMGVVGVLGGYAAFWLVRRAIGGRFGLIAGAAFGGWVSTVLAAVCCAGQLALSGTAPASVVLPAMATIHMLIGVGEAIITALVVSAVAQARPDLLESRPVEPTPGTLWRGIAVGLLVSLGIALCLSPFASELPDGLEHVAERHSFADRAAESPLKSLAPDYKLPGVASAAWATALAGGIGTIVAFGLALGLAYALSPRRAAQPEIT